MNRNRYSLINEAVDFRYLYHRHYIHLLHPARKANEGKKFLLISTHEYLIETFIFITNYVLNFIDNHKSRHILIGKPTYFSVFTMHIIQIRFNHHFTDPINQKLSRCLPIQFKNNIKLTEKRRSSLRTHQHVRRHRVFSSQGSHNLILCLH